MIDFSLDQSSTATGICVWRDGKPVELVTLRPSKGCPPDDKHRNFVENILTFMSEACSRQYFTVSHVVLEGFENHRAVPFNSLKILFEFSGYLQRAIEQRFLDAVVSRVSKGRAPKSEAQWLAKAHGFNLNPATGKPPSEHAMDALHIGIVAGLGKG